MSWVRFVPPDEVDQYDDEDDPRLRYPLVGASPSMEDVVEALRATSERGPVRREHATR